MTIVRLLLAFFLFQVSVSFGVETTTTLVPTPTSTPSSTVNQVVKNETMNILNTTAKSNINATAKSNINATAKSILNTTAKSILNTTAKSILNTTAKSILNTTAKSILNTTGKINFNLTKKLNITAAAGPSPKLDEIVKKINTSVDEINKTTRKSWFMIRGIICVISIYGIYKIYATIQKMRQKKKERDKEDRLILPGTPSTSSPKNSIKRSASSGFFAPQEQTIRAKSPENSNLRQRVFSSNIGPNIEPNKWHV
jgi:hypothetical protein